MQVCGSPTQVVIPLLTDDVCLYQQPLTGLLTDAAVSTGVSSLASWTLPPLLFTSIVNKPQPNYPVGLQQTRAVTTKIMPVWSAIIPNNACA